MLQIGMHKVLEYVKNHKDAWPFMDPVEEDIAPRYYSIIRRPMDLLKMEEKLDNEEYLRYSDFRNDFKLIVNNCRLYNGNNTGGYRRAGRGGKMTARPRVLIGFLCRVHGDGEQSAGGVRKGHQKVL